jgi:two-component system sensor histidine kinase UhpB
MIELQNLKVLVVEDNLGDYIIIKDYLEEKIEHLNIVNAIRFEQAYTLIKETEFDVILLDLTLPDNSGEDLIEQIVEVANITPVIILTGFTNIQFSIRAISFNISDYLVKDDINASSLIKSILYSIERKKSILLLEASEKRYSNLFELSPQPMWIFNINTLEFFQVNQAAVDQYGYSKTEFLEMKLFDIVIDDLSERDKFIKSKEISFNQKIFKGRFKHRKKTGEIIDVDIYSNLFYIDEIIYESAIAIDVTEKIKLEHHITRAIIKTQEDERYEIGAELHDNVCQILASSQLSLDMLQEGVSESSKVWLNKSKHFIHLALEEIRNLSHRLAPSIFGNNNLEEIFSELLLNINFESQFSTNLVIEFDTLKYKLSEDLQLNLYRIVQEQLRNIIRHSKANSIQIKMYVDKEFLKMEISDNGIGLDESKIKKGIGLANIKRRIELFNGEMQIISARNEGCNLLAIIPLDKISYT